MRRAELLLLNGGWFVVVEPGLGKEAGSAGTRDLAGHAVLNVVLPVRPPLRISGAPVKCVPRLGQQARRGGTALGFPADPYARRPGGCRDTEVQTTVDMNVWQFQGVGGRAFICHRLERWAEFNQLSKSQRAPADD